MSGTSFMIIVPARIPPSGARKLTWPPTLVLTDTRWSAVAALLRISR